MRSVAALGVVGVLVAGCSGNAPKAEPEVTSTPVVSGVQVFSGLSHTHLGKGQYPQSYPQSPPVGGPHSRAWLKCQVYDHAVPKENAVHSMEHGGIWLTYATDLPPASVAAVVQLAKLDPEYVLVSPYSGQDSPVIATTWGLQLKVSDASDPRLVAFIKAYAGGNQGGEAGSRCASSGATLAQAEQFDRSQR